MFAFISIGQYFRQEASWERERWDGIGKILQVGSRTRDAQRALVLYVGALPTRLFALTSVFFSSMLLFIYFIFFKFVYL